MPFDDEQTPLPMLFDPARETDPRAREWAQREVEYVTERAQLREEVRSLRRKLAQLAIEVNRSRSLHRAAEKKEVK